MASASSKKKHQAMHVIRMRASTLPPRTLSSGGRWDRPSNARPGACGEDQKLRSGGYVKTDHRITAGGLPTGNTVSGIDTLMFGNKGGGGGFHFEPQFSVALGRAAHGQRTHSDHVAANYSLIGNYGPGPGGYARSEDIVAPNNDRVPGYYACKKCGRGGHWSFECASGRHEDGPAFSEAAEMLENLAPPGSSSHEEGARRRPEDPVYLCAHFVRNDHAEHGLDPRQCWGMSSWLVEKDLERPQGRRACRHCGAAGHYTYDCHGVGSVGSHVDPRSGLAVGKCPACRIAEAVLRKTNGLTTAEFERGEVAGQYVPADGGGPCGRPPSFLRCRVCGSSKHHKCECTARAEVEYGFDVPLRSNGPAEEGPPSAPPGKPPSYYGCQVCGSAKHFRWACPKSQKAA